MGQICSFCGFREELRQTAAFEEITIDHHSLHSRPPSSCLVSGQQSPHHDFIVQPHIPIRRQTHPEPGRTCEELNAIEENDRQRKLAQFRLEQVELARREAIVTTASQSMVPVGSQGSVVIGLHRMINNHHHSHHRGGGMNSYYDPAYAAAAAQDILRSAAMTGGLVFCSDQATLSAWRVSMISHIPVTSQDKGNFPKPKDVIETLERGRWGGVRLGSRGSGLAGCGGEDPEYYLDDLSEAFLETMVPTRNSLFGGCVSIVENLP